MDTSRCPTRSEVQSATKLVEAYRRLPRRGAAASRSADKAAIDRKVYAAELDVWRRASETQRSIARTVIELEKFPGDLPFALPAAAEIKRSEVPRLERDAALAVASGLRDWLSYGGRPEEAELEADRVLDQLRQAGYELDSLTEEDAISASLPDGKEHAAYAMRGAILLMDGGQPTTWSKGIARALYRSAYREAHGAMDAAEVRRLRAAAGLTQGKLAAKVGLSLRQIAYLEAGERRVEDDVAERIRTVCTKAAEARKAMSTAA